MVTIVFSKSCKSFSFDEIWNSTQIEGPEFNGDKIFCDYWGLSILTPVDIGTYHFLGDSFGPKTENLSILMKSVLCRFCTLHKPRVVNSMVTIVFFLFLMPVNIDNCQYWYLLSIRPQSSTKNNKCSNFHESFYFTQNESCEFSGFNIKRCKWVPQRIKTWNQKTNLLSKILLLHYKQNWYKIIASFRIFVLLMKIMSTQLLV